MATDAIMGRNMGDKHKGKNMATFIYNNTHCCLITQMNKRIQGCPCR